MDIIGLQKAIDKLGDEVIPQLEQIVNRLEKVVVRDANALLDRIDGTRFTGEVSIPPCGKQLTP
jgi:hypothetical protein